MPVYATGAVNYGAEDPNSIDEGFKNANTLMQGYAQRQAGGMLASGDTQGAEQALYRSGNLAGGQALQEQDRTHMLEQQKEETQFILDTATSLKQVKASGGDPVAAFDKLMPVFQAREGSDPQTIQLIRNQLAQNPDLFLDTMTYHAQQALMKLSAGEVVYDPNTKRMIFQTPSQHDLAPGHTLVESGGEVPQGVPAGAPPPAPPNASNMAPPPGSTGAPQAAPGGATLPNGGMTLQQAVIRGESGGNPNVRDSIQGARGIGQIMPATFAQWARPGEDINNPQDNAAVSSRILEAYSQQYGGDPARAAVAYFSGPGNVAPAGSPTPWRRDKHDANGTRVSQYVAGVLRRMGTSGAAPSAAPAAGVDNSPDGVTTASGVRVLATNPAGAGGGYTLGPDQERFDANGKVIARGLPKAGAAGKLAPHDDARLKAMDAELDRASGLSNLSNEFVQRMGNFETGWQYNRFGGHGSGPTAGTGGVMPGQIYNQIFDPEARDKVQELNGISQRMTPMLRPAGSGRILGQEYANFGRAAPSVANSAAANRQLASEYKQEAAAIRDKVIFYHNYAATHGNLDAADMAWYSAGPNGPPGGGATAKHRVWDPVKGLQ